MKAKVVALMLTSSLVFSNVMPALASENTQEITVEQKNEEEMQAELLEQEQLKQEALEKELVENEEDLVVEDNKDSIEVVLPTVDDELLNKPEVSLEDLDNTLDSEMAVTPEVIPEVTPEATPEVNIPDSNVQPEIAAEEEYAGVYYGYNSIIDNKISSIHYSEDLTTEKFISAIGEQARQIALDNDLFASIMIAQAILESGSGSSELSKAPNYNLFGIKGSYEGNSVNYVTKEDDGKGNLYSINSNFRKYKNISQSLEDYSSLLKEGMGSYYKGAWKSIALKPENAAKHLQGRYATDTRYAEKLMALIHTYDLTRYDNKLSYEIENLSVKTKIDRKFTMKDYSNLEASITSKLGFDYVWGGESDEEGGYDCSGLIQYAYKEAFDVELPRTSQAQQHLGIEVNFNDLIMGDLLFFQANRDTGHVAMYLGNGNFIEAPTLGEKVKISSMEEHKPTFAKRIINMKPIVE